MTKSKPTGGTDPQSFPTSWLGKGTPWSDFLFMRMRLIRAFMDEGKTAAEIFDTLQMDRGQVQLLMMQAADHRDQYL